MVDRQGCKGMSLNDGEIEQYFQLTLEGSIFQRVGAPTAKVLILILVLTRDTRDKN